MFPAMRGDWPDPAEAGGPMCETGVQRAFRAALLESGIHKKATVHTLRHSYGRSLGRLVNASMDAACW